MATRIANFLRLAPGGVGKGQNDAKGTSPRAWVDSSANVVLESSCKFTKYDFVIREESMAEKAVAPQQPVISIRISEALRTRLERLKEVLSKKSGGSVSTSEVAKQLLESAREDRLEVAELLSNPTASLDRARRKIDAGYSLARAEWIVLAYFAYQGIESAAAKPVSNETLKGILEAFLAAWKVRRPRKASHDARYLANLPIVDGEGREVVHAEDADVATVVERLIRKMNAPNARLWPQFAARNLYELLEEEQFGNVEALNRALKPHWTDLWKAAARGHYLLRHVPVRDENASDVAERRYAPALSSIFEGGFVLSFAVGGSGDLSLLLNLPADRKAMYEIAPYPVIAEFRSMLQDWDTSRPNAQWKGSWFFGYTASAEPRVWIRSREAVSFGFSDAEWAALKEGFRRAWEMPALQRIWDELSFEYGEQ
jgi:hypothetical protein